MLLIVIINSFRGQLLSINWLRNYLLPCPFKYITGLDCPGCGFQRAVLALAQGNFVDSFNLYPPAVPLILLFIYSIADRIFNLDYPTGQIKKALSVLVGTTVLVSYFIKLWHIYD